jgi:glycosyltransferase involved in cell wall biosynthesis
MISAEALQNISISDDFQRNKPTIKDKLILIVNPQGCVGLKALNYMNYPGTTCFGGQISYVLNLAEAFAKIKECSDNEFPEYETRIISQRVQDTFNNDFDQEVETTKKYFVDRIFITKQDVHYIDKEALLDQRNHYYSNLPNWGKNAAEAYLRQGKVPSIIILNYWDSYVALSHMLDLWKKRGITTCPKIVVIPHSLGYRKLISVLVSKVKARIESKSNQNVLEVILSVLKELMDDERVLYPQRILTERIMLSNEHFIGCVNSQTEKEQLLIGPYGMKFKDYASVKADYIHVDYPGIDSLRFGEANKEIMEPHEKIAKDKFLERRSLDISKERQDLPIILAVGRLHYDKNFHSLAMAFKENKQLNARANLVFIVNGPLEDKNENYILKMQKALKDGQTSIKGFIGSSLEQLINLAKILDANEVRGKWTAVSLPDGRDYAGIQRYLGKEGHTISGLFSLKEPYGLSPWENIYSGIPVVVSQNSGVAEELIEAGAYSFNPIKPSEIAFALMKTLDEYDFIKKKQMAASRKKDWCETAKRMMKLIEEKENVPLGDIKLLPIDVNNPSYIQNGKDLITKAIKYEYKIGINGELKEIFETLTKKYETV